MSIQRIFILISLLSLISGCYFGITGRVIDAETNQPIEGAVLLVEWTKTHGFGEYWTESYKVAETLSGKDGKFDLPGCYSPFVNKPHLTIYKSGYVAWSSRWIFPGMRNRTAFHWGDDMFKLDRFIKEKYSYVSHVTFISLSINESINSESKSVIVKAYDWESKMANEERERKRR